ncbi:TIGR02450 family Trp-rich protein [Prochlorococcus sp. AH-716-G10]|nr:TIGR02450 family Trp-rich protein [Prochlorococcus sp. AH-716-G10]
MENYWTSNESINGLRHFVLVNKNKEQDQVDFLMVSVVDVEISLRISNEELLNSGNWNEGWLNLPKSEAITKDYSDYKLSHNSKEDIKKIFVKNDSLFDIT